MPIKKRELPLLSGFVFFDHVESIDEVVLKKSKSRW